MKRPVIVWISIAAIAVMLLIGILCMVYVGVHESLEAERTHLAYVQVLEALTQHVRTHDGQWPHDWNELAYSLRQYDPFRFHSLGEIAGVSHRVEVRFDVTSSEVFSMDSERFSAVSQVGPNYGQDLGRIAQLKDLCRPVVK